MEFVNRLRAGIERGGWVDSELLAANSLRGLFGAIVVKRERRQASELLGVVAIGLGNLHQVAGNEIVDRGQARRFRMAPGRALNWSEPRKSERVARLVHPQVSKHEHINGIGENRLASGVQIPRHENIAVG